MSLSGEDYHQLPVSNSYPSEYSCTKHSSSNHTFIEYIQTTQEKRRDRITAVCDKCHVSSDYISAKANKLKDASTQPHCEQLTDIRTQATNAQSYFSRRCSQGVLPFLTMSFFISVLKANISQ